jgi:hypothetical protein
MADETIGGEGIRQDWRIDGKQQTIKSNKRSKGNNRTNETNTDHIISISAAVCGSANGAADQVDGY